MGLGLLADEKLDVWNCDKKIFSSFFDLVSWYNEQIGKEMKYLFIVMLYINM